MKREYNKSTFLKGNELELKAYTIFSKLLAEEKIPAQGKLSKIFHKKGYYSDKRKKNIITDISIETFLEGADKYFSLIIIECKNYKKPIPVDDIEEFDKKLDQIAGKNVKGIMVTQNGFQESTITFAESSGIALVRLVNNQDVVWDVFRAKTNVSDKKEINREVFKGLTYKEYTYGSNYCFCYYNGNFLNNISMLLNEFDINSIDDDLFIEQFVSSNTINIPFIDVKKIENISNDLLKRIKNHYQLVEIPINDIVEYIQKKHRISFVEQSEIGLNRYGEKILAQYDPCKNKVEIDKYLDEHRKRFSLAHEIGHIILHSSYLKNALSETEKTIMPLSLLNQKNRRRAEIQANIFASCLLMPREIFINTTIRIAGDLGYKFKNNYLIYVDNQPVNINNFYLLLAQLSSNFNVSYQAIEFRLKYFELLVDERNQSKSIKEILKYNSKGDTQ